MSKGISRRQFIVYSGAGMLSLYLGSRTRFLNTDRAMAIRSPQIALAGKAIPQFVDEVPNLLDANHLIVDDGSQIVLQMKEHKVNILPAGAVPGYTGTYVWSYLRPGQTTRTSYLGPVVQVTRGAPTEMKFVNMPGYCRRHECAGLQVLARTRRFTGPTR